MRPARLLAQPLIWLIRIYQLVISPLSPPSCRYYPSCSAYAVRSLERHGVFRGTWLATRRLLRCHPWSAGGVDHVPGTPEAAAWEEIEREKHEQQARDAGAPQTNQGSAAR